MKKLLLASVSAAAILAAPAFAQSNTSTVDQNADSSQAYVTQNGSSSSSTIGQTGADNWVDVNQGASGSGNQSTVTQNGADMAGVPTTDAPPPAYCVTAARLLPVWSTSTWPLVPFWPTWA